MTTQDADLNELKAGLRTELKKMLRKRKHLLTLLIENENRIDTYNSNLKELNKLENGEHEES